MHSNDPILNNRYRELCANIGHLFVVFARLECTLTSILKLHLSNNFDQSASKTASLIMAGAIYGSMRFKASRDTIKRIAQCEKTDQTTMKFVLEIFEQVAHIESFRDKLAHQSLVTWDNSPSETWVIHDTPNIRDIRKAQVYEFTADTVARAANDLVTACDRIGNHRFSHKLFPDGSLDLSPIAWLYKPSLLKVVPRKRLNNLQGFAPPLQS